MADRFRPLWDFDDLAGTEQRFRALLAEEPSEAGRAEALCQLARVEGLRGHFGEADGLLDEADGLARSSLAAQARVALERGRVRRSAGDAATALPYFDAAYSLATRADESFVAADAAHMAALATPDPDAMLAWTQRGIELAESSEGASYWAGPLLNNLGWAHYHAGEHAQALDAFERALRAREAAGDPAEAEIARYAVGKALRALGSPGEAAALLERSVAWAKASGSPDGWFHEELAECYAALGREADAREQSRLALPLLERDDPSLADDEERATRLRALAGEG